ncbi:hypothetical protein [Paenibacillus lutrae]|uniref:GapA-binding peptide SR1P n=1 Tax=Paenibacillus lutrae TaxID=2078573 RepID=A0A7X3JZZ8_9BACL|nr:hypothetical protein [Paenibacillus lutrae]MVP00562.1 hypothetical protein [Paenibacillus lutrae]
MEKVKSDNLLGTLLCKWCDRILGELDTDRVMVYYMECSDRACTGAADNKGVETNEQAVANAL